MTFCVQIYKQKTKLFHILQFVNFKALTMQNKKKKKKTAAANNVHRVMR